MLSGFQQPAPDGAEAACPGQRWAEPRPPAPSCGCLPGAPQPWEWLSGEEAAKSPKKPSPEPACLLGARSSLRVACARATWSGASESLGADPVWGDSVLAGTEPSDSRVTASSGRQSPGASFHRGAGKRPDSAASPVAASRKRSAHGTSKQSGGTKGLRGAALAGDHLSAV